MKNVDIFMVAKNILRLLLIDIQYVLYRFGVVFGNCLQFPLKTVVSIDRNAHTMWKQR